MIRTWWIVGVALGISACAGPGGQSGSDGNGGSSADAGSGADGADAVSAVDGAVGDVVDAVSADAGDDAGVDTSPLDSEGSDIGAGSDSGASDTGLSDADGFVAGDAKTDSGTSDAGGASDVVTDAGPGYPTELPDVAPPEQAKQFGGLYQCEEPVSIPSGAEAPGPCFDVYYPSDGGVPGISAFGYDCVLRLRIVIDSYFEQTDAQVVWRETQYDWTDDGLLARWEEWRPGLYENHKLSTWKYYDDGSLKESYELVEWLYDGTFHELTIKYEYLFDDAGRLIQMTTHADSNKIDIVGDPAHGGS